MEPYIGEIRIFSCNFAPKGWAFCNGQPLAISQNTALFSLLGTTYGGDGRTTFNLPDLRDRVPLFWGQAPGLSAYTIGEVGGTDTVTLLLNQLATHNHQPMAASGNGQSSPVGNAWGTGAGRTPPPVYVSGTPNTSMAASILNPTGGSLPHANVQPYLTLNFCIALQGIFPPRP